MAVSLLLASIWIVAALRTGGVPDRVQLQASWVLIATGIPLLGLVTLQLGPIAGLLGLALGAFLIRGPRPDISTSLRSER